MDLTLVPDAVALAAAGAARMADAAVTAIAARGIFTVAVSGGQTPWTMLQAWSRYDLPWPRIHVFQVDERVAPDGHDERNWTHLHRCLAATGAILHPVPVTEGSPVAVCEQYAADLAAICGDPIALDLIHLGLGADGHTASLLPGDPVLGVSAAALAVTRPYGGWVRVTLTYPVLAQARALLWVVGGSSKADALRRLMAHDPTIPAGRVSQARAHVLAVDEL